MAHVFAGLRHWRQRIYMSAAGAGIGVSIAGPSKQLAMEVLRTRFDGLEND
jgi:hypothetical protein